MFLKIMFVEGIPDSDPSRHHKMVEVSQYDFFQDAKGEHTIGYVRKGSSDEIIEPVLGNIYVLNDQGKTINSIRPPAEIPGR